MEERLKKSEYFAYGLGDVGINFLTVTMVYFLSIYYTDSVGISAGVVGTMMFISRIFDGASDLGMGLILDRTHTKWGKARPWIIWTTGPLFILFLMIFNVPMNLSQGGKVVYMYITYFLFYVIFFTAFFVAYNSLVPLMTRSQDARNKLQTTRFILVMIAALVIASLTMPIQQAIGWTNLSIIYGVIGLVCFLITFFKTKETVQIDTPKKSEKGNVKEDFKSLSKNKFFIPLVLIFLVNYIIMGLGGVGVYYAKDVIGNVNIMGIIALVSIVPQLIGLPMFPALARKFGKYKCFMVGNVIRIIGKAIFLINPTSLPLYAVSSMIVGLGGVPSSAGMFALIGDVIDYGEWKTNRRTDGLINSVASFGNKVGNGLGVAMVGWLLAFGGYDGAVAAQNARTIEVMKFMNIHLPIILFVTLIIITAFCNIDKIYPQIKKDLEERRTMNTNHNIEAS